jgi:transcriptional antiterminator NusG
MGMEDEIFNVVVPMEDDVEVRDGRKKVMKKKVFPGYALVEMIVNDRSWYVVRNTPGVTGFVGSGTKPIPLTDSEVKRILRTSGDEELRPVLDVEPGQAVHIHSGAFENFPATVTEVDQTKGKLKALVDMFGRETVVELDFDQVEKI